MPERISWQNYHIRQAPTYGVMTDADFLEQAFNEPFSLLRTGGMVLREAVKELPGLGTGLRSVSAPADAPTQLGFVAEASDGTTRTVPYAPPAPRGAPMGYAPGMRSETATEFQRRRREAGAMGEDTWKQSRYFREGLTWDAGMTEARAAAMAQTADRKKLVDFYAQKRPVTSFLAGFSAGFADPINYIPIVGWGVRGAGIARSLAVGAADAAANTALFGTLTMSQRRRLGDEVSIEAIAQDTAIAALTGVGIGALLHGAGAGYRGIRRRLDARGQDAIAEQLGTIANQQQARIPLSEAVTQLAGGDPVNLGPNSQAVVADMTAQVELAADRRARYAVTPTGTRVEVRPEVIDASQLLAAAGDLQPRDRSRAASDAQIAEMAANLDPDRLLPAPEADRGAPIIGPDNIVESGNGRVAAIRRAAEQHPERFVAYRQALKDAGYDLPDGGVPILVQRRLSDLTPEQRVGFVNDANTSAIARMSATEQALADTRAMTASVVDLHSGGEIGAAGNRSFVSAFLRNLPENERAGLVDANGALNADGVRRVERALVASAYGDADLVARAAESLDDNAKSITGALVDGAARWSRLRRQFEAREYDADLDLTGNLLDALRTISKAREDATAQSRPVHTVLSETLKQQDMFVGEFNPRTEAIIRALFADAGLKRAKSREKIAELLNIIADEIDAAGRPQLFGDTPSISAIIQGAQRRADNGGLFVGNGSKPGQGASADPPRAPESGRADGRPGLRQAGGRDAGKAPAPDAAADRVKAGPESRRSVAAQAPTNQTDLAQAASSVGRPDTFRAIAEQYKIDPATGAFAEEAELAQLLAEGRLLPEDRQALDDARETFKNADAFDQALQAAARCII